MGMLEHELNRRACCSVAKDKSALFCLFSSPFWPEGFSCFF